MGRQEWEGLSFAYMKKGRLNFPRDLGPLQITKMNIQPWQGLELVFPRVLFQLMVLGDSMIEIRRVNKLNDHDEQTSISILQRIKLLMDRFDLIEFYHVKRNYNRVVDSLANKGVYLEQRVLNIDEGLQIKAIPCGTKLNLYF